MPNTADAEQWREYLVTPRYLAGSDGTGDAGFAPVAHWPHHHLDEGPCQLLVSSPDGRIRIGWFGDDFELWKITAGEDAVSASRWTATFNHVTPAEIVAGLTSTLAHDYAQADPAEDNARFIAPPSLFWADTVQPLIDAGWTRGSSERGTVELLAPDRQAGASIDIRLSSSAAGTVMLWAGPPGWGTRAEAVFTARTPAHLVAATAAAMADPAPVIRERHMIHRPADRRCRRLWTSAAPWPQRHAPRCYRTPAPDLSLPHLSGSPPPPSDIRVAAVERCFFVRLRPVRAPRGRELRRPRGPPRPHRHQQHRLPLPRGDQPLPGRPHHVGNLRLVGRGPPAAHLGQRRRLQRYARPVSHRQ